MLSKININLDIFNSYFINRYISLIFSLGTLVFLNKILNEFFKTYSKYFIFSYVIFIYWYCFHPGGISSRPDSISAFLTLLLIYSLFVYFKNSNVNYLNISIFLNFILFTWDPGKIFPLLFLSTLLLPYFVYKKKYPILFSYILGFFAFVLLFLGNSDLTTVLNKLPNYLNTISKENFNSGDLDNYSTYLNNFLKDITLQGRFNHLKIFYTDTYYFILILYFLIFICILLIPFKKNLNSNSKLKVLILYFIFINFFLFLAPNKWLHHFTQTIIIICLILPIILFELKIFNKFLNNRIKYVNIILLFFIIIKFYTYTSQNIFLYRFLVNENLPIKDFGIFDKMKNTNKQINLIKTKKKIKSIIANPIFKYIFIEYDYIGTDNLKKLKIQPDLIILQDFQWTDSEISHFIKKINVEYKLIQTINFNNNKWKVYLIDN